MTDKPIHEDYFDTHGGEAEREIYGLSISMGQEVVSVWTELYPAIAIPQRALYALEEMIQREIWGTFTSQDGKGHTSARDLLNNQSYINDAIRAGLRYGEPIDTTHQEAIQKEGEALRDEFAKTGTISFRTPPPKGEQH